jgi:hypothetical protein
MELAPSIVLLSPYTSRPVPLPWLCPRLTDSDCFYSLQLLAFGNAATGLLLRDCFEICSVRTTVTCGRALRNCEPYQSQTVDSDPATLTHQSELAVPGQTRLLAQEGPSPVTDVIGLGVWGLGFGGGV